MSKATKGRIQMVNLSVMGSGATFMACHLARLYNSQVAFITDDPETVQYKIEQEPKIHPNPPEFVVYSATPENVEYNEPFIDAKTFIIADGRNAVALALKVAKRHHRLFLFTRARVDDLLNREDSFRQFLQKPEDT